MKVWPGVYESLINGGLKLLPTSPVGTILAVGPASDGDDNEVYIYGRGDKEAVRDELGVGELPDRIVDFLDVAGPNGRVIAIPANKDVASAPGALQATKPPAGAASPALGGAPNAAYMILIQILKGGAFADATFRYSLDNGVKWSGTIAVPAESVAWPIPGTGLTLTFTDGAPGPGSFVEGDEWTAVCFAPTCTLGSLLDALNAGVESKLPFEWAWAAQPTDSVTWAGLGGWADDQFDLHRSVRVLTEAPLPDGGEPPGDYAVSLVGEMDGFAHDRVAVCVGLMAYPDFEGASRFRGISGVVAGMIAAFPVQRSIGSTRYGRLPAGYSEIVDFSEADRRTLHESKYIVATKYVGLAGWFIADGVTTADVDSDYQTVENCRVMDHVIRNLRARALTHLHSEVLVTKGTADTAGLKDLEADCKDALRQIRAAFSSGTVEIPEGQDVLATSTIQANIQIVPYGYMKKIDLTFGLVKV